MTIRITWSLEGSELIPQATLECAAQAALEHGGRPAADVDVILLSDEALADLHARFLDDPSPTDVIAFDLGEDDEGPVGEVYVSVDCARRVAESRGVTPERELVLYLVHGCLHLCGYDDHEESERAQMRRAESLVLERLGYPPDDAPHEFTG